MMREGDRQKGPSTYLPPEKNGRKAAEYNYKKRLNEMLVAVIHPISRHPTSVA